MLGERLRIRKGKKHQVQKKQNKEKKKNFIQKLNEMPIGAKGEKEFLLEDMAMLIDSGMDISTALLAIKEDSRRAWMKALVGKVRKEIDAGIPVWKALEKVKFMGGHVIALIKIGEESGRLAENLKTVVLQHQKDRVFRSKIQSAMMYPVFVLGLTSVVGVGVSWFILPRLSDVFSSLDMELPLITQILIMLGGFLENYGHIAAPATILVLFVVFYIVFLGPKTKVIGQWILFILPGIRNLIKETEVSRFGFVLGTLLSAGLPIVDALQSLEEASTFYRYKKFYKHVKQEINDGGTFSEIFADNPKYRALIPASIQQMIKTAEQSGSLPETLQHIGKVFEEKTDTTTKNLSVVLEPILLIVVWLGVVGVALAIILPIYSLVGGLSTTGTTQGAESIQEEEPTLIESIIYSVTRPFTVEKANIVINSSEVGYVNIRLNPSIDSALLGTINNGEKVPFIKKQAGWYFVQYNDLTGWVSEEYATEVK
ncbi:type II secretion system F family protein [Patescibacteria group bacterium]|nr:type II secretion system F family protein [Patescibacteria group bacterium]